MSASPAVQIQEGVFSKATVVISYEKGNMPRNRYEIGKLFSPRNVLWHERPKPSIRKRGV